MLFDVGFLKKYKKSRGESRLSNGNETSRTNFLEIS